MENIKSVIEKRSIQCSSWCRWRRYQNCRRGHRRRRNRRGGWCWRSTRRRNGGHLYSSKPWPLSLSVSHASARTWSPLYRSPWTWCCALLFGVESWKCLKFEESNSGCADKSQECACKAQHSTEACVSGYGSKYNILMYMVLLRTGVHTFVHDFTPNRCTYFSSKSVWRNLLLTHYMTNKLKNYFLFYYQKFKKHPNHFFNYI